MLACIDSFEIITDVLDGILNVVLNVITIQYSLLLQYETVDLRYPHIASIVLELRLKALNALVKRSHSSLSIQLSFFLLAFPPLFFSLVLLLHALPPCLAVLELLVDSFQETTVAKSQVV